MLQQIPGQFLYLTSRSYAYRINIAGKVEDTIGQSNESIVYLFGEKLKGCAIGTSDFDAQMSGIKI
jgi:hypothetical protein